MILQNKFVAMIKASISTFALVILYYISGASQTFTVFRLSMQDFFWRCHIWLYVKYKFVNFFLCEVEQFQLTVACFRVGAGVRFLFHLKSILSTLVVVYSRVQHELNFLDTFYVPEHQLTFSNLP